MSTAGGDVFGALTAPHIICLGDLMVDVVARAAGPLAIGSDVPARIDLRGGGSGANVAAWLAYLRHPVTFAGRCGDDAFGREAVAALERAGVRCAVTVDAERATGTCVVVVSPDGERSMLPDPGANDALSLADVRGLARALQPGRHLHLSGYALLRDGSRPAALALIRTARERRMTISVDPSSAALLDEAFLGWTAGVEVLLANADEVAALTGITDPRVAAQQLAGRYGEVVVTCGGDGALWQGEFVSHRIPAEPAPDVLDTTGAGDAFTAGWLSAWLQDPDPHAALAAGARLAALAVSRVGARP